MRTSTFFTLLLLLITANSSLAQLYYGVKSPNAQNSNLFLFNSNTGNVVSSTPVTLAGTTISGFTGLAHNPADNKLYTVIKSSNIFILATIDHTTGAATHMANLPESFAGIAFSPAGELFGISGDGSATPTTLYTIDPATGASDTIMSLFDYGDGEAIAYNSTTNLLLRYGGNGNFETIDPVTRTATFIGTYNGLQMTSQSLSYNPSTNSYLMTAGSGMWEFTSGDTLKYLTDDAGFGVLGYKGTVSQGTVLNVEELAGRAGIKVFPNPATDAIKVDLGNIRDEHVVNVYNISGQVIFTCTAKKGEKVTLPVKNLAAGIYYITAEADGSKLSGSFIKE